MDARTNRCYNEEVLEPITFVLAYPTVSTTSDNTGTLLVKKTPRQMPLPSDVVVVILVFMSIAVLTRNGQFLDCATIAFSERYKPV